MNLKFRTQLSIGISIVTILTLMFLNILSINNLRNIEQRLHEGQPQIDNSIELTHENTNLSITRTIISFFLLTSLIYVLNRELFLRNRAEKQLQQLNSELDIRIRERTIELEDSILEVSKSRELLIEQLSRVKALREIDLTILGSNDLYLPIKAVIREAMAILKFDAICVHLFNANTRSFTYIAGQGFHTTNSILPINIDKRLVRQTIENLHMQYAIYAIDDSPIKGENFVESYALPLAAKGYVNGVIEFFSRQPLDLPVNHIDFMNSLAGQASIAITTDRLFHELQESSTNLLEAYDETIKGWAAALELRDYETEGHSQRVTSLVLKMAHIANMREKAIVHIRRGALLHDIGKLGVSDTILNKPGPLTEEERKIIEQHPVYAFKILSPIGYLRPALDIPYCHHEKWDGSGYPRGLVGKEIPLSARLFAVVDVWDALRSDRPYRKAWTDEKTLEHIKNLSGTHFDPQAVEYFLRIQEKS